MTTQGRIDLLRRLAAHAAWADETLLGAVSDGLDEAPAALREYLHVLGAAETWLARIEGRAPTVEVWPAPTEVDPAALRERVEAGYATLLAGLHDASVPVQAGARAASLGSSGDAIDDVLLHVALHGQYHRGKINALLRAAGSQPARMDYIAFRRREAAIPDDRAAGRSATAPPRGGGGDGVLLPVTMVNRGDLDDIEPGVPERYLVHSNWYWHQASLERPHVAFRLVHPVEGGEAVGMVAFGPRYLDRDLTERVSGDAEIHHLVIDHRHRGRGLGRAVVAQVLAHLRTVAAYRRVVVAINPDNVRSLAFFGALGGTPLHERNYDDDPLYELVGALDGRS